MTPRKRAHAASAGGLQGREVPCISPSNLPTLVRRAEALAAAGGRRLLGITGAPGAGKSTLAEAIVAALTPRAVLVPMDGFHLAEAELIRLGRRERKGAIDTFDGGGFVALLRRLQAADEEMVYAPSFRREIEEPIAGAVGVPASMPLVVIEGNYLLAAWGQWSVVRTLLDEVWYVEPDEGIRLQRLIDRHMRFGRDRSAAEARARGSDQHNAELIAATRDRADLIITEEVSEGAGSRST